MLSERELGENDATSLFSASVVSATIADLHVELRLVSTGTPLLKLIAITVACFLSGRLTVLVMDLDLEASPIWFPAGVALSLLLLGSQTAWIGVSLGSFLFALSVGATWSAAVVAAIGTVSSAIVGKKLLRRANWSPTFNSLRDALSFLALAVVLSPIVNATMSTLNACVTGLRPWHEFGLHWLLIELGDGIGILVAAPLLLVWLSHASSSRFSLWTRALAAWRTRSQLPQMARWRILEALLWVALLLTLSGCVFFTPMQAGVARYPSEYLPIALMVWAALRFGQRGTVLSGFTVSCFALWGLAQSKGPLLMDANGNMEQAVFLLQAFIGVTMGTALMLTATIAERQQAEMQLRFAAERERLLAQTAQRIRRSLNLDEILQTTVAEVRQLLHADRVFIIRLDLSEHSLSVAESVASHLPSVQGWMSDQRVAQEVELLFKQESSDRAGGAKPIRVIDNIEQVEHPPLVAEYHRYCQVKASIGIPIMVCDKMFGILLVNQCSEPRHWQPLEINLLEQLATQVEIALQQGQLYQHLQALTASLEGQVQERTAELQQRMQELQSLNQVKDLLLHAVAHDLRTPVQGMSMVLKSLRSKSNDCPAVPVPCVKVDRMIQSCDHQLNLLNALLEGHSDDTPAIVLQCQRLNLCQVVDSSLKNLNALLTENQITLNNQVSSELPPIQADPQKLCQVFESLLLNAVKHNAPGLTLTVSATVQQSCAFSSLPTIHCTIADNGKGLSQNQCDRLFHLYIRGIDNQHLTGIGLGLHRCKQIITAHGGQVGVASHPGNGAQFWFTLPVANNVSQDI